jgi:NAD-dependent deacetylase
MWITSRAPAASWRASTFCVTITTSPGQSACNGASGRPDVVWFGEMPYHMEAIFAHLAEADVFAAIGTSGQVYPAAAFVQEAGAAGAHTVELNLEPSAVVSDFAETRFGPASRVVPDWVDDMLDRAESRQSDP